MRGESEFSPGEVLLGKYRIERVLGQGGWGSSSEHSVGGDFDAAGKAEWDSIPSCHPSYQTWTSGAGANEKRLINCVSWYEAAAFCIWDGGFLPSEAEWQYAAAGGSENRKYPWGADDPTSSLAVYSTSSTQDGGSKPAGNGRWGHSDLAGNVYEWALDWLASPYPLTVSIKYANVSAASNRVGRSGSFYHDASFLLASYRIDSVLFNPTNRSYPIGARCARTP